MWIVQTQIAPFTSDGSIPLDGREHWFQSDTQLSLMSQRPFLGHTHVDETVLVPNKLHEMLPKLPDKLFSFCTTRKEDTVLNKLHNGHSYLTHSFILRKEEAPV